jgi:hypothetical protein
MTRLVGEVEADGCSSRCFVRLTKVEDNYTMRYVRAAFVASIVAMSIPVIGCAYGGAATSGDNVVVLRNDGFLFGMMRQAFVCKVSEAGLNNCKSSENP